MYHKYPRQRLKIAKYNRVGLSSRHFTSASIRLSDDFTSPAEKISRTQNKDKITFFQKLQAFYFINKKSKKQMKLAAIGAVKGKH